MNRRSHGLVFATLLAAAGCGDSTPPPGVRDLAMLPGDDAAATDDAGENPDLAQPMVNVGQKIVDGKGILIQGTTDDDHIIFSNAGGDLMAAPIAGGKPVTIATKISQNFIIRHNSVLAWQNVDMTAGTGDLIAWHTGGSPAMLGSSSPVGAALVTFDSGHLMYLLNSNTMNADLYVANADGTGAKKVLDQTFLGPSDPALGFGLSFTVAHRGGDTFFIGYNVGQKMMMGMPDLGMGGRDGGGKDGGGMPDLTMGAAPAPITIIAAVNASSGALTTLKSDANPFMRVSDDGKTVLVVDNDMTITFYLVAATGGKATKIDSDLNQATFLPDNATLLYSTAGGQLKRVAVAGGAPTVLAPNNVTSIVSSYGLDNDTNFAVSGDGKWALVSSKNAMDAKTGLTLFDVLLAATDKGGAPTALEKKVDATLFFDGFTEDSTRAIYYNAPAAGSQGTIANLWSAAVSGGAPTMHAVGVWNGFSGKGAKLVYNDNYVTDKTKRTFGRADVKILDAAAANATPTVLATQAEANFYLTQERDKVVYSYNLVPGSEGIYVTPIP